MRYGADRRQRQPKHQLLKEALVRLMEGLPMDAPLPAERELSEAHGISRQTVRQALQQLVAEGRIYRRQGSGTYVASHKVMQAVNLDGRVNGGTGAETAGSVRLVGVDRRRPDPQEAAALGLAEGTEVLQIERLRIADGEGVGVERVTVDAARFDGLWASAADADALPRFFWDSHGLEVAEAEQTIEAVPASAREAGLLGVADGIPLLLVRRRTLASEGRPAQLMLTWYRGDRFRLSARQRQGTGVESAIVLRPARRADAPVLARIFVQSWRSAYHGLVDDLVLDSLDEAEIASRFHDFIGDTGARHNALLAIHGSEPVGFVRFGEDPDLPGAGHVFSLYVTPESMGLGVGRTLLTEVLAELAARGHRRVTLWVFEANTRARRLYERMGFEPDGSRRVEAPYGAQEVRLSRELGS